MSWKNSALEASNNRIRFEELKQRERDQKAAKVNKKETAKCTTSGLPQSRIAVIEALTAVVEDQCKARGTFYCRPKALLLMVYKKSPLVYDEEFHSLLAGDHIDKFVAVIRPHLQAKKIDASVFRLSVPLLRFRNDTAR